MSWEGRSLCSHRSCPAKQTVVDIEENLFLVKTTQPQNKTSSSSPPSPQFKGTCFNPTWYIGQDAMDVPSLQELKAIWQKILESFDNKDNTHFTQRQMAHIARRQF